MDAFPDILKSLRWQDLADILIVSFVIYRIILIIQGTRAVQMLAGIAFLIIVYFGARELELLTLYWLLGTVLSSIFLIIIIIFQNDISRALTQFGRSPFAKSHAETLQAMDEIVNAAVYMSEHGIGSLMVIERETGLKNYLESGHSIDAGLSKELLVSLFLTNSPLHDGAVVISRGRIATAGCLMPLTRNPYISKQLGTRHRAAIGLSEETDAVVVVVSEETRQISLVQHGAITRDLDKISLKSRLDTIFVPKEYQTQSLWKNWLSRS